MNWSQHTLSGGVKAECHCKKERASRGNPTHWSRPLLRPWVNKTCMLVFWIPYLMMWLMACWGELVNAKPQCNYFFLYKTNQSLGFQSSKLCLLHLHNPTMNTRSNAYNKLFMSQVFEMSLHFYRWDKEPWRGKEVGPITLEIELV